MGTTIATRPNSSHKVSATMEKPCLFTMTLFLQIHLFILMLAIKFQETIITCHKGGWGAIQPSYTETFPRDEIYLKDSDHILQQKSIILLKHEWKSK